MTCSPGFLRAFGPAALLGLFALHVSAQAPEAPRFYLHTAFENASPLYWSVDSTGTVVVRLVYDHERFSPNRANGHWHFRIEAAPGTTLTVALENFFNIYNGRVSNPLRGDYLHTLVSPDGRTWRPVPARLDADRRLVFDVRMPGPALYVASVEPYRLSDLDRLLDEIHGDPRVQIDTIGATVEGRPLEMVRVGAADAPHHALIRARAHPWEPGGSWVVQGLIRSLLADTPESARFLERYAVHVLPVANKDGVARGRTRFNANGVDLNRGWDAPADPDLAPENAALEAWLETMIARGRGPDLAIELHNDMEGQLHISPPGPDTPAYLDNMRRFEALLREHTWFTEGSRHAPNPGTLGAGLLHRYGIDALVYELRATWIAGLDAPASGAAWERLGEQLRHVLYAYFEP